MMPSLEMEPRPHWWKVSALTTNGRRTLADFLSQSWRLFVGLKFVGLVLKHGMLERQNTKTRNTNVLKPGTHEKLMN